MEIIDLIRLILGCFFIIIGLIFFFVEIFAVYRLKYTLNRMHFAGSGDTMALACTVLGAVLINGFNFTSAKLVLVLVLFWFTSPVSSHLIARMVANTDETLEEHVKIYGEEESKEFLNPTDEDKK